nr:MAG: ORF1 [Torque teno midi virus]
MPFWWGRRKKFWYGRRRFTRRRRPFKRRYRKRTTYRRNRRAPRRRKRRKQKVRRKKKRLILTQWQPETIRKCKIKGFIFHTAGAQGRQIRCFSDTQTEWVPPRSPGGGGFSYEKYTLETLYKEHLLHHNIWTKSNVLLELVRYTGCTFKVFRHPHVDFIFSYQRSYPMTIDKYSYMECHPAQLLLAKHKVIIPSMLTQPHGKNYRKIKIKPPQQMVSKWFYQDLFADTGLVSIKTAAADLRYSYLGCCNENTIITFIALNNQFYQNCGWGNEKLATSWYLPYAQAVKTNYSLQQPDGKIIQQNMSSFTYKESIDYSKGWFSPAFLQCVKITVPQEDIVPTLVARYNPHIDSGEGNYIWLQSTLKMTYGKPLTDPDLILDGKPLWLMLYGFFDWVNKKKGDTTYIDSYVCLIQSPAILPKRASTDFWVPIDKNFYLGKAPYEQYLTTDMKAKWFPTVRKQMQTLNAIIMSGPFIPKFDNIKLSTWELHSKYIFYFKWGGSQLPDQDTANPKHQHHYVVPDTIKQAIQITDPKSQKKESILHSWDFRRGLATKSAIKRMYENLESDAAFSTDSEQSPQKKFRGTAIPVQENKEKKIQECLLSLFEENTCQEEETQDNLKQLIKQQQEQQQLLKLNLLQLISDLRKKQQTIQLQTGLLS